MVSIEKLSIALAGVEDMSDRLEATARLTSGNIVEIGGGEGINTIRFLWVARNQSTDVKVIVVDPFMQIPGFDESYFLPYKRDKFLGNIRRSSERIERHLHLIEFPSQHPHVSAELKGWVPIGFMFIDGLQDKESVMSDIRLAVSLEAEVICIDDYDRLTESSQVPVAVDWFRQRLVNYEFVYNGQREIYLVRK